MRTPENIFLVGSMEPEKAVIGKQLAKTLQRSSDSDNEIEARTGVDIAYIFDIEGEEVFSAERQVIDELSQERDIVLATGGGAVLDDNRAALMSRGFVVYLMPRWICS